MALAPSMASASRENRWSGRGLGDRAGDKARDLSGGQMRRVEIARALLHAPKLLLLDEPTVGLDIKARADILAHVRDLVKREGLAVLWTTHLIDEIEPGDRVIVLHQGKMLANGTAAEIVSAQGVATIGEAFERLTAEAIPLRARGERVRVRGLGHLPGTNIARA